MKLKEFFGTWRKVFTNWKYLTTAIIIAVIFYSINVLISNWNNLVGFYPSFGFFGTIKFFSSLFFGFKNIIKFHSYISIIIVSIMLGILFSLIGYKINFDKMSGGKKFGFLGGIGVFLAAFAPGCAACGVGLAAILGLGVGFLSFFPFEGLELSIISMGILGFSILKITKNMYICKISKSSLRELKGGEKR